MSQVSAWRPSVGRRINRFLLDLQAAGRGPHDMIDALILLAIIQANVAPPTPDGAPAPLDLADALRADEGARRPVSINSLAHRLGIPFETTRRRIKRLAAAGRCQIGPEGVTVPPPPRGEDEDDEVLARIYDLVKGLYLDLVALGSGPDTSAVAILDPQAKPPVRLVGRLAAEYYLRIIELWAARPLGFINGFLMMAVLDANTAHIDMREDGVIEDARRRPARPARVAERLGFKAELPRRRLHVLADYGALTRTEAGFILPGGALMQPDALARLGQSAAYLEAMFEALDATGVLALWAGEDRRSQSA